MKEKADAVGDKNINCRDSENRVKLNNDSKQMDISISSGIDIDEYSELKNQLKIYKETSDGGVFVVNTDDEFTLLYANDIYYQICEHTKDTMMKEFENKSINCIYQDDIKKVRSKIEEAINTDKVRISFELRIVTKNKKIKWVYVIGNLEKTEKGFNFIALMVDITKIRYIREKILRSEERYRIALKQTDTSVWEYDIKNHTIIMTESAEIHHGFHDIVENVPDSLIENGYIHPSSCNEFRDLHQKMENGEEIAQADILLRTNDGTGWWWERVTCINVFDDNGNPIRAITVGEDITKQKEVEIKYQQELQMRDMLSDELLASSRVNLTKNEVEVVYYLSKPMDIPDKGMTYEDMIQIGRQRIENPNDIEMYNSKLSRAALFEAYDKGEQVIHIEYRCKSPAGRLLWVSATSRIIKDFFTGDIYVYGTIRDIDIQKRIEKTLLQRVDRDTTTNAYDKKTSIQMMEEAVGISKRENIPFSVAILSVDNYSKIISDLGYTMADDILKKLTDLLRWRLGNRCILGRFYGNEIVVFVNKYNAKELKKHIADVEENIKKTYSLINMSVSASISVGMAEGTKKTTDFKSLYNYARIALDVAQSSKKGNSIVFDEEMAENDAKTSLGNYNITYSDERVKKILLRCAFVLNTQSDLGEALIQVLRDFALYYDAERAYIILPNQENNENSFFEWKKDDVLSKRLMPTKLFTPESIPTSELDYLSGYVELDNIEDIRDEKPDMYQGLKKQGIKSFYSIALAFGGNNIGYFCIDIPVNKINRDLSENIKSLLSNDLYRRMMQKEQEYLSSHDKLTGLLNRNSFIEYRKSHLEERLISVGIVSVDINGLKKLNNQYGNEFGDNVIKQTADNMKKAFFEGNTFRFAGDEFLAVCENLTHEAFYKKVEDFRRYMNIEYVSISIGYVWADSDLNLDDMISKADERMIISKQEYYKNLDTMTKSFNPQLRKQLINDIANNHYKMFLQPKADIKNGEIIGAEALVRYISENNEIVAPNRFIPKFEEDGLISHIDLFIFEEVCRTQERWKKQGVKPITVSLNFSRATMIEENLIEDMEQIASKYDIDKQFIEIEITESIGIEKDIMVETGRRIRECGYKLSLDDFGAKFSNIAVLSVIKFDVLKFDKTLINDLFSNSSIKIIVSNLLAVCKDLNIKSIAEGVETIEQFRILKEMGCDYAQGYYLNKPIPLDKFENAYINRE